MLARSNIIKKDQLEVRLTLCFNKIPEKVNVDTIKNVIISYSLYAENVQRVKRKNVDPTTLILLKLKNEKEEQNAKR